MGRRLISVLEQGFWAFALVSAVGISSAEGHALCDLVTSRNLTTDGSSSAFINNFSASKCLRIEQMGHFPNSHVKLDACFWGREAVTKDENFYLTKNSLVSDGVNIKNDAGTEKYCLTTNKKDVLATTQCNSASWDQVWRLKPVSGKENQFLIQQVSSANCLVPRSGATRSYVLLTPCNSLLTEQIWNLCFTFQLRA